MAELNILELNPPSEIKFVKKDIQSIPEGFIELNNISDGILLYKIKTTDPNKYVVKPNLGVITQGRANRVIITTHKTSMQKIKSDRFLILAGQFKGDEQEIPTDQKDFEVFVKKFFDQLPKEKQFMK